MKTAGPCPRSRLTNAATLSDDTERWVELHLISIWRHRLVDRLRPLAAFERDQWGESLRALWFIYLMFGPAGGREGIYWNTKPYTLPGSNSLENKDLHCRGGAEIYCIYWPLLKKDVPRWRPDRKYKLRHRDLCWECWYISVEASRGWRFMRWQEMQMMKQDTTNSAETLGFCRRRANSGTFQSTRIQRHIIPRRNPTPHPLQPFLNKPSPMHTKRLVARRWMDFVLCLRAHTHAWLQHAVILMWFHLHARDPFVFIIITRLEETDLFGLVEMAPNKTKQQLRRPDVCHVNATQAGDV